MSLLVDLGNTRLKWAQVGADERLGEVRAVAHDGDVARAVQRIDAGAVEAVRVASVGGPALNAALRDALRHRFGCEVLFAETRAECAGLHVAYADPSRLGVDRWLAMLGVWRQQRGAFCVVSAGTALTFDAVDADGRHLGGLIAPGVTTMAESVLGRTRFPADSLPEAAGPALGTDTESCVAQGALHAALGLIDRAAAGAKGLNARDSIKIYHVIPKISPLNKSALQGVDAPRNYSTVLPAVTKGQELRRRVL